VRFADALNLHEFGDAMVIDALIGLRSGSVSAPRFNLDGNTLLLTARPATRPRAAVRNSAIGSRRPRRIARVRRRSSGHRARVEQDASSVHGQNRFRETFR